MMLWGLTQIKESFNQLNDDRNLVGSDQHSSRLSTSWNSHVTDQVHNLIMKECWLTIGEIANDTKISDGSAHAILTDDLGMQKLYLDVTQDMLECANGDLDFLKAMITSDECWVLGYNPETKAQSLQWKSPVSPRYKESKTEEEQSQSDAESFFDY